MSKKKLFLAVLAATLVIALWIAVMTVALQRERQRERQARAQESAASAGQGIKIMPAVKDDSPGGPVVTVVNPKKETSPQIATTTPQNSPTVSPTLEANKKSNEKPKQPPVPAKPVSNDIDEYRKLLRSIDSKGDIVRGVSEGLSPDQIKITVANSWHYEPYQMRLQLAQKLWETWARLHSPSEPDKARIKIVDLNDNEVGGSRVWAGSLIWVQED